MAAPFNITPASALGTALGVGGLLTARFKADVVGVFNQETLRQVFTESRPMKADVQETAKVMEYPVESGVTLSDHKVINPTIVDLQMLIPDRSISSAYQEMRNAWTNSTKLMVQTRTGIYRNMIIAAMPHREDPDLFDVIPLTLRLREVQYITASSAQKVENYAPLDPRNTTAVPRGFQSQIFTLTQTMLAYIRAGKVWGL